MKAPAFRTELALVDGLLDQAVAETVSVGSGRLLNSMSRPAEHSSEMRGDKVAIEVGDNGAARSG